MKTLGFALATDIRKDLELPVVTDLATNILSLVMQHRRYTGHQECQGAACSDCLAPHKNKVTRAILLGKPISFVLPAFPGKSPNPQKVLGALPDMAEILALKFLNQLCEQIKALYSPGAHITLSSDGRVFSDIIGMREVDVTDYLTTIDRLIKKLGLKNLSTFALDELYLETDTNVMRSRLMKDYGGSLESLHDSVKRGGNGSDNKEDQEAHRIYCGITRFLVEDSMHPGQIKSRTAIQNDCRRRAYQVILRSNAWSRLIADRYSDSVRLSIHPQTCGAVKLGIKLLGEESWMTPWHGVAVETQNGFVLMKRWQAEEMKAELVFDSHQKPSHFKMNHSLIAKEDHI